MNDIKCPIVKPDSTCYWKDVWQKFDRMRQLGQLTDVSLVTKDRIIFMAHSPVLAASSNYFHDLLIRQNSSRSCEQTARNLFLNGINSDVLTVTLDFIYGITPSTRQSFEKLQIGAKEMGIMGAYEYCSKHLKKMNVTVSCCMGEDVISVSDSSYDSLRGNLTNCTSPVELPSVVRSAEIDKGTPILAMSVCNNQNGEIKLAVDRAEGSAKISDWHVNGCESVSDLQRTNEIIQNLKIRQSVYSLGTERLDSEFDVVNQMPSDDVHAAVFTQMSLGDLTAGIRCPLIKEIIGEDNPMETFLIEDELADDVLKQTRALQDVESDFEDVSSALEEQKNGIDALMPLKKRKRLSPDDGDEEAKNTFSDKNTASTNLLSVLEANDSIFSKDMLHYDSNNQSCNVQNCGSSSSHFMSCGIAETLSVEMQVDQKKSFHESIDLKSLTEPSDSTRLASKDLDDRSAARDLLPGYGFLYPCISTVNQHYNVLNKSADLNHGLTNTSISQKQYSSDVINGGLSQDLQVTQTSLSCVSTKAFALEMQEERKNSVGNSIFAAPCETSNDVCSGSFLHLSNQQMPESSWKDSSIWNVSVSQSEFSEPVNFWNLRKPGLWESMSNLESNTNYSHDQKLTLDPISISSLCKTTFTCKSKISSSHGSAPHQLSNESSSNAPTNTLNAVPFEDGEIFSFSVSGPSQGTVPSSIMRSQPNEISPNIADVSFPLSSAAATTADETLLRDKFMTEITKNGQSSYCCSSSDHKGENNQSKLEKCCSICGKVFKSASQLNIHHRRIHLRKDTISCSAGNRSGLLHQCQYCHEFFKSSYKLQTHQLKVHSKGKLFSCKDCSFRSPRKKDVQAHMLSQHGFAPSGVKVYSCSSCSYKCIDRNRFEEHEAKHTGITSHCCPLCSRAYTTKRGMRTHLKYHSEERPHKCGICGAAFKVTSKLSDHMKLIHLQKRQECKEKIDCIRNLSSPSGLILWV